MTSKTPSNLGAEACAKAFCWQEWRMSMYLCCKEPNFVPHTTQEREALSHLFLELFWVCQLYLGVLFSKSQVTIIALSKSFEFNSSPILPFRARLLFFQNKMLSHLCLYSQNLACCQKVLNNNLLKWTVKKRSDHVTPVQHILFLPIASRK